MINPKKEFHFFLNLPRPVKKIIVVLVDAFLCFLYVWLSYYLRTGEFVYFISLIKFILLFYQ